MWTVSVYLEDTANFGDYVSVNFNGESGTYSAGWRVLSKSGTGRRGVITLISAGCPLTYYHPYETNGSYTSLEDLDDLSSITITESGRGFRSDTITGATSGEVDLATQFASNSYFDTSKGIHAFGCNTLYAGTTNGTNTELETLYKYITGANTIAMSSLILQYLTDSNLSSTATSNGKTMDTKCNGLITCGTTYWLGGAPCSAGNLWDVYSDGIVNGNNNSTRGVRPVVSLKSGVKVADDNTGTGASSSPITLK